MIILNWPILYRCAKADPPARCSRCVVVAQRSAPKLPHGFKTARDREAVAHRACRVKLPRGLIGFASRQRRRHLNYRVGDYTLSCRIIYSSFPDNYLFLSAYLQLRCLLTGWESQDKSQDSWGVSGMRGRLPGGAAMVPVCK
jgi:hypothetical protein